MNPQPTPNWWTRNWKWFVPVGALGLVGLTILFVFGILALVTGAMKSSDAYKIAVERAAGNPAVIAALGSPVEPGTFVSGSIKITNSRGRASLSIAISGPDGRGTIRVRATKSSGTWNFSVLTVEVAATGERIDLLATPALESAVPARP